jgi:hypothetical protein
LLLTAIVFIEATAIYALVVSLQLIFAYCETAHGMRDAYVYT